MRLESAPGVEDVRLLAKKRLPQFAFDFIDGGAEDEVTLRANRRAFEGLTFRPRYLQDVTRRDQETSVVGTRLSLPVMLAPTGLTRIASRNAEVDAARAAGREGTVYVLSAMASTSIEDVARAAEGPLWFQLYLWRDRTMVDSLVSRAEKAGYQALVVAVDVPVSSKRERDYRNGFVLPPRIRFGTALDAVRHPRWLWDLLTGPPITFPNVIGEGGGTGAVVLGKYVNEELCNPAQGLDDLRRLRDTWKGPLLVKGTLTVEDAEEAVACGVDGIIVSNHGGRQLDCAPASVTVLPEIVEAVRGRADVLLDSGVRRGSDVVKALALGAKACLIGRPYLYGLAVGGEVGARRVIEILRTEIDLCLALIGSNSVSALNESVLRPTMVPGELHDEILSPVDNR
jgi:isopentenyl diphosphate isomerase/L-lactate dehydrogenase-like FMN-dependent dehydrogenase